MKKIGMPITPMTCSTLSVSYGQENLAKHSGLVSHYFCLSRNCQKRLYNPTYIFYRESVHKMNFFGLCHFCLSRNCRKRQYDPTYVFYRESVHEMNFFGLCHFCLSQNHRKHWYDPTYILYRESVHKMKKSFFGL
jgi:hypothetical protein